VLCRHLQIGMSWLEDVLAIPAVLVFTGHMIDRPQRPSPRFPSVLEPFVRDSIAARLAEVRPMAAYGSAACGADILCLEEIQRLGGETHVILPFPPPEFRKVSVEFAEGDWSARFERVIAAADSVTVTSDHHARDSSAPFEYANLVLTGMGRLRAQVLDTRMRGLAVVQPETTVVPGGAVSVLRLWRGLALEIEYVSLADRTATRRTVGVRPRTARTAWNRRPPAAACADARTVARHPLAAVRRRRGLHTAQRGPHPQLRERVPRRGGRAQPPHDAPFEHIETAGDGLYVVFTMRSTRVFTRSSSSSSSARPTGLSSACPTSFNIRIALHVGRCTAVATR
jgi:hypothetical protein